MPASAVTVTATFKKIDYAINIASDIENGEVTAVATANYGDEVALTITPATGYELETLSVKDADNGDVLVENNKFTMPASAVMVTARNGRNLRCRWSHLWCRRYADFHAHRSECYPLERLALWRLHCESWRQSAENGC